MRLGSSVNRFGMSLCLVLLCASPLAMSEGIASGGMLAHRPQEQAKRELNFDQEIKKQEKKISLRYRKGMAPKYTEVKYYRYCRQFKAQPAEYDSCNKTLEKKRYAAWKRYWKAEPPADNPQDGQVAAGKLEVTLLPKAPREPAMSPGPRLGP